MAPTEIGGFDEAEATAILAPISVRPLSTTRSRMLPFKLLIKCLGFHAAMSVRKSGY